MPSFERDYTQERSFLKLFLWQKLLKLENWLLTSNAFRETTSSKEGETVKKKKKRNRSLKSISWVTMLVSQFYMPWWLGFWVSGMMCFFYLQRKILLHWKTAKAKFAHRGTSWWSRVRVHLAMQGRVPSRQGAKIPHTVGNLRSTAREPMHHNERPECSQKQNVKYKN